MALFVVASEIVHSSLQEGLLEAVLGNVWQGEDSREKKGVNSHFFRHIYKKPKRGLLHIQPAEFLLGMSPLRSQWPFVNRVQPENATWRNTSKQTKTNTNVYHWNQYHQSQKRTRRSTGSLNVRPTDRRMDRRMADIQTDGQDRLAEAWDHMEFVQSGLNSGLSIQLCSWPHCSPVTVTTRPLQLEGPSHAQ